MSSTNTEIEYAVQQVTGAFRDILKGPYSVGNNLVRLGNALSLVLDSANHRRGKYQIEVKLIKSSNEFTGMCVYPDIAELTTVLANLSSCSINKIAGAWNDITKYIIEIDEDMFDSTAIAFNPEELTAMALHELGHIVFSSYVPERLYRAFRTNMAMLDMMDKKILKQVLSIFYAVPTLVICSIHKWYVGPNNMYEEYYCDNVFNMPDAKEHMASALNKIIKKYGNSIIRYETEDIKLHEVDTDVKWCNINIKDISKRRGYLQAELLNRAARTKSTSMKRAYLNISARLGIGLKDRYTHSLISFESVLGMVDSGKMPYEKVFNSYEFTENFRGSRAIESVVDMAYKKGMQEAMESFRMRKPPVLPSDYALDEISIEVDKIENHSDRLYVLDLIYAKLDAIDAFEKWAKENDQYQRYSSKIQQRREYLAILRQNVISKKLPDKQYNVYVQYPKGYEG